MEALNQKNNYYVVQFKQLPYANIGKYIIIPDLWVRAEMSNGHVLAAYPSEDPVRTRDRVKNYEGYGNTWQNFIAAVKKSFLDYHDAEFVVKKMEEIEFSKNGRQEIRNNNTPNGSESSVESDNNNGYSTPAKGREISSIAQNTPKGNVKNTLSAVKSCANEANQSGQSSCCLRGKKQFQLHNTTNKRQSVINLEDKQQQRKQDTTIIPSAMEYIPSILDQTNNLLSRPSNVNNTPTLSTNYAQVPHSTRLPTGRFAKKSQHRGITKNRPYAVEKLQSQSSQFSKRKPILRGMLLKDPCTFYQFSREEQLSKLVKDIRQSFLIFEKRLSVIKNSQSMVDQSFQSLQKTKVLTSSKNSSDQNRPQYNRSYTSSANTRNSPSAKSMSLVNKKRVYKHIKNTFNAKNMKNPNDSNSKTIIEDIKKLVEEKKKHTTGKNYKQTKKEAKVYIDNDNSSNNEYYEPPKKQRKYSCPCVLPPEYDPNDTKWTLKHRKAGPGIIDIMPPSRVYVDAKRFAYCKEIAKDGKELARMLLTEIFSLNALRVCSLTGKKTTAVNVRPGLDNYARLVLLIFVLKYGRTQRWSQYDAKSIIRSIRNKLYDLRTRHAQ